LKIKVNKYLPSIFDKFSFHVKINNNRNCYLLYFLILLNEKVFNMAFSVKSKKSGKTYYLHTKEVTLIGDRKQRIYYFAGEAGPDSIDKLPAGYEVTENSRTGLPMLRKEKK
jgi:hypothetical protein